MYDALLAGRLIDALELGEAILSINSVTVEDLHLQLEQLQKTYVTILDCYSPDVAMQLVQRDLNDSKLVALVMGRLILRMIRKERKETQKRKKVFNIILINLGGKKRKRDHVVGN